MPKSLQDAILYFADFEHCRQFITDLRWPDGTVRCPVCDSDKVTYLPSVRRWKCYGQHPKPQFSLKTGTIFEDSALGLDKWLVALWLLVNCKNGISSAEIARHLDITQKSAWFMAHRLRFALHHGSFDKLSGEVEVDETFIGGKAQPSRRQRVTRVAGLLWPWLGRTKREQFRRVMTDVLNERLSKLERTGGTTGLLARADRLMERYRKKEG